MNIDLNLGGLLGALFGGILGGFWVYLRADGVPAAMGPHIKFGVAVLIAIAIGGNFLWAAVRGKKQTLRDRDRDEDDDRPRRRDRRDEDEEDRPRRRSRRHDD